MIVDIDQLRRNEAELAKQFQTRKPFKYVVIDNFLIPERAKEIAAEYPSIDANWLDSNGMHQKRKWTKTTDVQHGAAAFFSEISSPQFLEFLSQITGIPKLLKDPSLQGAGYHQILDGGFLNVHVDFNRLGDLHRRLNLIVYMNPVWIESFGGYLELWDMERKIRIENIAPVLNRCVIFETNEISYHGHPVPLRSGTLTRKSLSVYYYTADRDDIQAAPAHNTRYANTAGALGAVRIALNGATHAARKVLRVLRSR